MAAAEKILKSKGFTIAEIGVEKDNLDARRLYERMGYQVVKDNVEEYSNNIKIIYDERKTIHEEITDLFTEAKNIFFLGFGYAKENLEAIGLDKNIFKKEQRIYGTALGLTEQEILKNSYLLREHNEHMMIEKFRLENCDSLMLLRNYLI